MFFYFKSPETFQFFRRSNAPNYLHLKTPIFILLKLSMPSHPLKFLVRLWPLKAENHPNRTTHKLSKHLKNAYPKSLPLSLYPNFPWEF